MREIGVPKGAVVCDTAEKTRVIQEIGVLKEAVVTDTGILVVKIRASKGQAKGGDFYG